LGFRAQITTGTDPFQLPFSAAAPAPDRGLVEDAAVLAEPEMVHIKGATDPVAVCRLIAKTPHHQHSWRNDPTLVGRTWELNTIAAILDEAVGGAGCVIGVLGPPGIGKSRIVRESAALASDRGVEVLTTYCESHTSDIAFHAVAELLRAALGVDDLDGEAARAGCAPAFPTRTPRICCCWMTCWASPRAGKNSGRPKLTSSEWAASPTTAGPLR
jgi:AAA ATPase domain